MSGSSCVAEISSYFFCHMVKTDVKASKALSWLLRHGAEKEGLVIESGGWIRVDDIQKRPNFKKFTVDKVKELVDNCPKQRFALKEEEGLLYIRANQGHSLKIDDSDLEKITSESSVPFMVHGTYYRHWHSIKKQGLSRMNRRHIHFAPGLPGEDGVISGMRSSCEIYIYVDLTKALAAGFKFFKSSNNVILCPGDEAGFLPPQYFVKVVDKKTGRRDKITLEKIVEYFLEYGVNNVIQQGNTVFIEFDSVETAKIVLEKRNYHIRTVSLRVFPMKDTIKDEATKVPISPSLKNCMSQAVSGSELIKYISFLIKEIELKPREHEARENLRRGIVNYLTPYFPKVVGHIFGSAANNLGFTGCDVDIYLDLGVYPWIEYESKAAAQAAASDLTWFLAKRIRQSGHAIKVEAVPRARVPIVKFQDRASGIMVDLSFRHGMPVYNTQLIYQYTQTHPLVRPYLMLIRYWAKVQGVAGGGKPSLLITNYALTMMMLFHLMHRGDPIVPSLAALRCNRATYTPVFIGPWDVGFSNYVNDWFVKVHRVTVMDLVSEFFSFYGEMDASQWVISPLTGMLLARDDVLTMSRNLPACLNTYLQQDDKIRLDTELCVQDPFEHSHNCTRGLIKSSFLEFQYKCRKAASISKNILKGEQTLNDLFQSIEVTPDMISDECQSSSQLKEDSEVITLDDSDVSQDIEVLDIQERLSQSENMMTNSEGTSDIEILSTIKRTPDIEILSDPQETSQDLEILASSQESVDLSQNSIKKEQEELESFRKRTNENKQSCSSGEAFEDCKKSQDKAMIDLSSTTGEGSGASQMTMENNSSHPLMLSNLGVCSKFLLDYSKVPVFLITPDCNIHRKNLNEHADTGQAACSFIQFVLQQCLKIDLSTVENCLTAEKRKALMQGDETTVEKYKKENDGNSVPVPLKYQRLTKYMCIARMALWNGRKKISKTVTRKLNESPLLYELAVTRAQLEKSALIYLPNDDSLSFTIEVWQELDNSKIIHVTGKSLSGTKVTQSQMIPMFSYFTSFCQNLLKKLTNFIDTNIH